MDRDTFREVDKLLDALRRKIKLVASKAVVELVKDSVGLQGLQVSVLAGETTDDTTEHMQPGGLTHVPTAGSEGVFLTIGGARDDGVLLGVSHRKYRPKGGQAGETTLYSDGDHQSTIKLLQDGSIVSTSGGSKKSTVTQDADGNLTISSASGSKVTINGVEFDSNGNVKAPGEVTAKSGSPGTSVTLTQHKHLTGTGPSNAATPGT